MFFIWGICAFFVAVLQTGLLSAYAQKILPYWLFPTREVPILSPLLVEEGFLLCLYFWSAVTAWCYRALYHYAFLYDMRTWARFV